MSSNKIDVYFVAHSAEEVQSGLLFDNNIDAIRYAEDEGMHVYEVEATLHFDTAKIDPDYVRRRLNYLRKEIEAERISTGEIAELQGLAEHIEPGDVLLLEWAGVPEDTGTRGCSCGEADFGAPGHDGDPDA